MSDFTIFNLEIPQTGILPWNSSTISAYTVFREPPDSQTFLSALNHIANHEYKTFLQLMDKYHLRTDWEEKVNFANLFLPEELVPWDSKNPILLMFGDEDFKNDAKHLFKLVPELTDIYEKDTEWHLYERVFILCYKGRYLAHVYYEKYDKGIIGIRSSLFNLLSPFHGIPNIKGVAFLLLEGYRDWVLQSGVKELFIIQPIGPMLNIAEKYGFDEETHRFSTQQEPNVEVPVFEYFELPYN